MKKIIIIIFFYIILSLAIYGGFSFANLFTNVAEWPAADRSFCALVLTIALIVCALVITIHLYNYEEYRK
jgi:cytochrome b subunit of formate dehydrogenase